MPASEALEPPPSERWILHGSPHSQFTYKVALMLRLSGRRFHFRYVSFQKGTHRTPEFLALSRFGQVPVLEVGSEVLCQSAAILEYVADLLGTFTAPDAYGRQRIREWLFWDADRLSSPIYGCYGDALARRKLLPVPQNAVISEYNRRRAEAALVTLDGQLGLGPYLAGESPSIADLACYGDVAFADLSELDLTGFQNIHRWHDSLTRLEGFMEPFELLRMEDAEIA